MTFKKETFVFLTSLALILIIGYINLVMSNPADDNEYVFDETALFEKQEEFANYTNDIVDKTDISTNLTDSEDSETLNVSSLDENVDVSFENFKISKAKNNLEIVDQIERSISSDTISQDTKNKFEDLLVAKNNQIQTENNVEIMLQSKGYKNFVCVVSNNNVKIITNRDIEKTDATKILDVVMAETKFDPQQIKIVKFNNNEL